MTIVTDAATGMATGPIIPAHQVQIWGMANMEPPAPWHAAAAAALVAAADADIQSPERSFNGGFRDEAAVFFPSRYGKLARFAAK
jgi:hypothetical protein